MPRYVPVCHRCQRMECVCADPHDVVTVSRARVQPTSDRDVPFVGGPYDGQRRTYPGSSIVEPEHWVIGSAERIAHYQAGGAEADEPRYVLLRDTEGPAYVWRPSDRRERPAADPQRPTGAPDARGRRRPGPAATEVTHQLTRSTDAGEIRADSPTDE